MIWKIVLVGWFVLNLILNLILTKEQRNKVLPVKSELRYKITAIFDFVLMMILLDLAGVFQ